ncbi:MAG TPA: gamma-glutamyl-gamma-aminobutyrate hydrolase family protein [Gemmatimonadales bacterium]|nr:gamma-glutamyl-gamma-aminobutyrate hydrolase family protein [Gemmatimonadales bacterium]
MHRPLIGITTQTLHSIDGIPESLPSSWVMNQRYAHTVAAAGGLPVLIPLLHEDPEMLRATYERLDGLFIPGGVDMDPATFHETPHAKLGRIDPPRDATELMLAKWAIDEGKPLFGLCRGLQVINVALGGTLHQDLETEMPGAIKHDYFPNAGFARDHLAHDVTIEPGSRLRQIVGDPVLPVNSMHHQGIRTLGAGLKATAFAPDGLVEALESDKDNYVVAVQWHPEALADRDEKMAALFHSFVAATAGT